MIRWEARKAHRDSVTCELKRSKRMQSKGKPTMMVQTKNPRASRVFPFQVHIIQGGPSGRGIQFADIKLKVPPLYKLLILKCNYCQQNIVLNQMDHPVI